MRVPLALLGLSLLSNPCTSFAPLPGHSCRARNGASPTKTRAASASGAPRLSNTDKLRELLAEQERTGEALIMPCCYDGLTARLVEQGGFPLTFMTGFGVSASHGFPDTQLISYAEMQQRALEIVAALDSIPCIGDGDTGYGNAVNVKRTVRGYAQAGLAAIMIEDQVSPKKCGHTRGKDVVGRAEALARVQAACDARDEGADILILARTDARGPLGMREALERCQEFKRIGADIIFLEAPESVEEMQQFCDEVPGPKLANMLEHGKTPILSPKELGEMGFAIAAYPLTLLSASMRAMRFALQRLKAGESCDDLLLPFQEVQAGVGFPDYWAEEDRYRT
eukprot:TRINITY_DN4077_c0_g2_i1.p1 TRINITY_DN4077_c0_g2~~TRINITY_DN4077_c0_g2_i1.p1  ORF type:complete len:339 (-),score=102.86 TRINITY_DN4077_c0_g2_i1:336-1352(-)